MSVRSATEYPPEERDAVTAVGRNDPLHCAFVHAPDPFHAATQVYGARFMPIWAYTLAAHIPEDGRFALELFDRRFDDVATLSDIDVFLFSGINQDYPTLVEVHDKLRSRFPAAKFVIGGPICWSLDQAGVIERLSMFDHVFIGDGEDAIEELLEGLRVGRAIPPVLRRRKRFEISRARPMHRSFLDATVGRYYGAVVEVSRGCPFLCEFCDIRILPDNNRPHNKPVDLIVDEIAHLCRHGVRQILLACDNFIGDLRWAEELVDALLAWQAREGHRPGFYTWLTINLYKHERLMEKMRRAGFDVLFIGIESFSRSSLLETAKVQNSTQDPVEAVKLIQSCGFIVAAGLIFGFDSDDETCFDIALNGLKEAGLLSGDPSFLTALPGTPLYRRMALAGRLRDAMTGTARHKYQTNIRYLMPREDMIRGFRSFIARYNDGAYQFDRLKAFLDTLEGGRFVPLPGGGYGSPGVFARNVIRDGAALRQMLLRLARFSRRPGNVWFALKALLLVAGRMGIKGRLGYFYFWLFTWTNSVFKYAGISDDDFDIVDVGRPFAPDLILPDGYAETADEPIPGAKTAAQIRATKGQLVNLLRQRAASAGAG